MRTTTSFSGRSSTYYGVPVGHPPPLPPRDAVVGAEPAARCQRRVISPLALLARHPAVPNLSSRHSLGPGGDGTSSR